MIYSYIKHSIFTKKIRADILHHSFDVWGHGVFSTHTLLIRALQDLSSVSNIQDATFTVSAPISLQCRMILHFLTR